MLNNIFSNFFYLFKRPKSLILLIFYFVSLNIQSQHISVSAIGDIMAHDNLQYYALATDKSYLTWFEPTKFIFLNDDLTIGNLETPICDEKEISGYPLFNANSKLATALKDAGIDVVSTANNHSLDKSYDGVLSTIEALNKESILFSGTGIDPDSSKKPLIFKTKGITIGYIAATFSLNGITYEEKKDSASINYFPEEKKSIEEYCKIIKDTSKIVDIMIVAYHCGIEYKSEPHSLQEKNLKKFADSGAGIVLAHHPHVLQKIEYYQTTDKREVLIAYSMGNFVSAQARYLSALNDNDQGIYDAVLSRTAEGVILKFDITNWNERYYVINPKIIPIFNVRFNANINKKSYEAFEVMPIQHILESKYRDELKPDITEKLLKLINYRLGKIKELIKLDVLELN